MASIEYVVNATGNLSAFLEKAGLTADHLDSQLEDLSKRIATPEVDLKDTKFTLGMVNAAKRLDKLSAMVADPEVKVDAGKAQLEILRLNAMLDRLDHKHVTATVEVNSRGGLLARLGGLFGGGGGGGGLIQGAGGAASGAAGTGGGILQGIGPIGAGVAIGGAAAGAAALAPAAIPTALGAGIGGLGLLLAQPKGLKTVMADLVTTLKSAISPLRGAFGDILKDFDRFIKTQGPGLRDMFKASLPFLNMFVKILEQAGKILLPVVTAALKQMAPALPYVMQGFTALLQGVADMIKAIGPRGMEASAKVFVGLMKLMGAALTVAGKMMNFFAIAVEAVAHWLQTHWKIVEWIGTPVITVVTLVIRHWGRLSHETAVIFDGIRHEIAHVWDIIYNNSIGAVLRIYHDVLKWEQNLRHQIASIFDGIRRDIADAWNTIWHNTVAKVQGMLTDVIRWLRGFPARAVSALFGLGHALAAFAHSAFTEMWNAIRNVAGDIWNWLTSWVNRLPGWLKHLLHISSPSGVFYDIGKQMMMGLFNGIKDHAHHARNAVMTSVGNVRFNASAGVMQWAPLVMRALSMEGLSTGLARQVLYQMQTESGGNPNAINLTDSNAAAGDPSRGLLQTIGSTFSAYHWPGTSWNIYDPFANIAAAINYARHRYGPTLISGGMGMGSGHGYDTGGWLPVGTSIAINRTGRPERVLGPGEGGTVININVAAGPGTNRRALAQELADLILYHTKTGGRLYPVGTAPR